MDEKKSSSEFILDRRRASRLRFEAKATVSFAGAVYSAVTKDLTPQGAFLVTDLPAPGSTPVELALYVHDGLAPIEVTGRVVRVASGPESPRGFAVEFDDIEAENAQRILAATHRS